MEDVVEDISWSGRAFNPYGRRGLRSRTSALPRMGEREIVREKERLARPHWGSRTETISHQVSFRY